MLGGKGYELRVGSWAEGKGLGHSSPSAKVLRSGRAAVVGWPELAKTNKRKKKKKEEKYILKLRTFFKSEIQFVVLCFYLAPCQCGLGCCWLNLDPALEELDVRPLASCPLVLWGWGEGGR